VGEQRASKGGAKARVYDGWQQGQGARGKLGLTLFMGSPGDFSNV